MQVKVSHYTEVQQIVTIVYRETESQAKVKSLLSTSIERILVMEQFFHRIR